MLNNPTREYRRILICRPNAQFDQDIGFLPGDEQEKISPLMRPIVDNLEQLIDSDEEERYQDEQELQGKIEEIFARGLIQTRSNEFHQRPFICEDLSDHRRGAEHDSESGERNHNKSRKRNEDHSAW